MKVVSKNLRMKEAIKLGRSLGVEIYKRDGTGEVVFDYGGMRVACNCRRHDAPRRAISLLRRAESERRA